VELQPELAVRAKVTAALAGVEPAEQQLWVQMAELQPGPASQALVEAVALKALVRRSETAWVWPGLSLILPLPGAASLWRVLQNPSPGLRHLSSQLYLLLSPDEEG